jgi:translation initiation factor IF-2
MSEEKTLRLIKVAKELNVGLQHVVEFLESKGVVVDSSPNTKISVQVYGMLQEKYAPDKLVKSEAQEITREKLKRDTITIETKTTREESRVADVEPDNDDSLKASLEAIKQSASKTAKKTVKAKKEEETPAEPEVIKAKSGIDSPKILGKIDLDAGAKKKTAKKKEEAEALAAEDAKKKTAKKKEDDLAEAEKVKADKEAKAAKEKKESKAEVVEPIVEKKAEEKKVVEAPTAKAPEEKKSEKKVEKKEEKREEKHVGKKENKVEEKKVDVVAKKEDTPPTQTAPPEHISVKFEKLTGPNILGKIQLPVDPPKKKPVASSSNVDGDKRKRKRKDKGGTGTNAGGPRTPGQARPPGQGGGPGGQGGPRRGPGGPQQAGGPRRPGGPSGPGRRGTGPAAPKVEPTDKEIQDQIKATLARLSGSGSRSLLKCVVKNVTYTHNVRKHSLNKNQKK